MARHAAVGRVDVVLAEVDHLGGVALLRRQIRVREEGDGERDVALGVVGALRRDLRREEAVGAAAQLVLVKEEPRVRGRFRGLRPVVPVARRAPAAPLEFRVARAELTRRGALLCLGAPLAEVQPFRPVELVHALDDLGQLQGRRALHVERALAVGPLHAHT